jgi:NADPH2:quinone reductase
MKAILVHAFGDADALKYEDVPDPVPAPGQVRVKMHAIGVNPFDTYMRSGGYAISPALPYSPGADGAGVVDAVGQGVSRWKAGDRVYIGGTAASVAYGAYAELVVCEEAQVHQLPKQASYGEGASMHVPGVTAYRALEFGRTRPGDTVLIHGATGGVGLACVQIAHAWGCKVIGTAGTYDGSILARSEGAHHVLRHDAPGYLDELKVLTLGKGPDVIVEMLANVNLDNDLGAIAPGGRVVVVGNRGRIEIDPRKIMSKNATITGFALWQATPDDLRRVHAALGAMLEARTLRPIVGEELPLADAAEAHRRVLQPGHKGRIVLVP